MTGSDIMETEFGKELFRRVVMLTEQEPKDKRFLSKI